MPDYVRRAIKQRGLMDAYHQRPAYQQNDYLGWIARSAKEETRQKRLTRTLDELAEGSHYMNMAWRPRRRTEA
jgi:uncharacterized protein YdeI (YjbR/CyaY-like superfamily)